VTIPQVRAGLSQETLVAAAVRMARQRGVESVTMRALAAELGVTQMAAYYYFDNKNELLEQVVDGIFATVTIPEADSGPWDERLRQLMVNQLKELSKYRGVGTIIPQQKMSPTHLVLVRAYLNILGDAGFTDEDAFKAYSMIHSYVIGRLLLLDRLRSDRSRRLERILDLSKVPTLHASDYVEFTVDVVIDGLKRRLER
jgi:TetR/AcrR family tetracycline transcriptional repressor